MAIVLRAAWALISATVYKLATNAYLQALLLALHDWRLSLYWLAGWLLLCAVATVTSRTRKSTLPGLESLDIFTTRAPLMLLGNEQEGNAPQWYRDRHPKWPRWLCAFVFMAWRNKLRNLAFWRPLAWMHRPSGEQASAEATVGPVTVGVRWRGALTELIADWPEKQWFVDIGPRLDQPDQWGGVSWAFRLGRY
jgi:hypothetical protein